MVTDTMLPKLPTVKVLTSIPSSRAEMVKLAAKTDVDLWQMCKSWFTPKEQRRSKERGSPGP